MHCIVSSGLGVWVSLQATAVVRLYHASTYENLCDVDVTQTVYKMLAGRLIIPPHSWRPLDDCRILDLDLSPQTLSLSPSHVSQV